MELWDLYDARRRPTGQTHRRGDPIPPGRYHLAVHVWIQDSMGRWLISQRAASRPTFPLLWECVGGSALQGEDSLQAALRETREETGIQLDPQQGKLLVSRLRDEADGQTFGDILDIWLFRYDGAADPAPTATGEVAQCRWLPAQQVEAWLAAGRIVKNLQYFSADVKDAAPPQTTYRKPDEDIENE